MNKIKTCMLQVALSTLCLLSFSLPAFSANLAFMQDTAGQFFQDSDWQMFAANVQHALNTLPNGKNETWINPKTGHGGSLMPLNSMKKNGTVCRNLRIINRAQHRTDKYTFTYCKLGPGWKLQQ